jgi:hypothetical protein
MAARLAHELGEAPRWTLVGGLMVQLHAFEHQSDSRLTDDIDVLGDSRQRPSMTQHIKTNPKTIGKYTTFRVPGGTQALNRSEIVMVSVNREPAVAMRRPSLLGAILIKARVVAKKRKKKFDSDRQDLILLLSLIDDPRTLASEGDLKKSERKWLLNIEEKIGFSDPVLLDLFPPEALTRATQAFRLLIS